MTLCKYAATACHDKRETVVDVQAQCEQRQLLHKLRSDASAA